MDSRDLRDLMHSCVEMGYVRGQIDLMPSADRIRKKDAEALLVRNGFRKCQLSRWVSAGLIDENRGDRNSPLWYSLLQVMETMNAVKYRECIT